MMKIIRELSSCGELIVAIMEIMLTRARIKAILHAVHSHLVDCITSKFSTGKKLKLCSQSTVFPK